MILQDGRVTLCCLDYNGVQIMGDVTSSSIREIWNNPAYTKARNDFKRLQYGNFPICLHCEQIR